MIKLEKPTQFPFIIKKKFIILQYICYYCPSICDQERNIKSIFHSFKSIKYLNSVITLTFTVTLSSMNSKFDTTDEFRKPVAFSRVFNKRYYPISVYKSKFTNLIICMTYPLKFFDGEKFLRHV